MLLILQVQQLDYNKFMRSLILTIFIFITFLITTPTAFAQDTTSFVQLSGCTGIDCTACHVVNMANGIIKWLIGITFLIFAALLMIAGVRLVTSAGNPSELSAAKEKFINAFIGFLIILSAWLIVDTIMRGLVGTAGDPESRGMLKTPGTGGANGRLAWSQIECQVITAAEEMEVIFIDLPDADINFNYEFISPREALPVPPGSTGSNCGVNESSLVAIPGQGGHRATADTVNRFLSMQQRLAAQGITLTVTSSYRSDARQTELWDGCTRCQTEGTVARPCSRGGNGSAHTSGSALDLNSSGNRCDIVRACRAAGASFIMSYARSGHIHCDWRGGQRRESLGISCP
jgi:hypothetical protein